MFAEVRTRRPTLNITVISHCVPSVFRRTQCAAFSELLEMSICFCSMIFQIVGEAYHYSQNSKEILI